MGWTLGGVNTRSLHHSAAKPQRISNPQASWADRPVCRLEAGDTAVGNLRYGVCARLRAF